ncbi:unnamed protein product, partial [Mesorhabditis spiculigera]
MTISNNSGTGYRCSNMMLKTAFAPAVGVGIILEPCFVLFGQFQSGTNERGLGSATTSSTTCVDTNSNCATWAANGFCTNSAYTAEQRASYCGGTCGCATTVATTTVAATTTTDSSATTTTDGSATTTTGAAATTTTTP